MNQDSPQFKKRQKSESHDPKASRDVSGMAYKLQKRVGSNNLFALNNKGQQLADMSWDSKTGRVDRINTDPNYQGLGIATNLWNEAHRLSDVRGDINKPIHSEDRTNAGEGWAKAVGGDLPKLNKSAGARAMDIREKLSGGN